LARQATVRILDAMCAVDRDSAFGGIWECYAPEAYRPSTTEEGDLVRDAFVGWGGLAPITLLIEDIIGLEFNAPENTVTFHLCSREKCGLENMIFNGSTLSIVCTEYHPFKGQTIIETESERPFKLIVETEYLPESAIVDVPIGKAKFIV